MDKFDPYQSATWQNIASFFESTNLTGRTRLQKVGSKAFAPCAVVYYTAKLVYHTVLRLGFTLLKAEGEKRRISFDLWHDKKAMKAWARAILSLNEGLAKACVADLNAKTFKKIDVDSRQLTTLGDEVLCSKAQKVTMGKLVHDGTLPAEGMLVKRGRASRFRNHYLARPFDYEEAYKVIKKFLSHPSATQQIPPLFLSGAYSIDATAGMSIPQDLQEKYWLVVARLRVEVCAERSQGMGERDALPEKIMELIERLEEDLGKEKGKDFAAINIRSFLQWINPMRETLIYQKAFALPTLELLSHLPLQPKERHHEEIEKERKLQDYVLAAGKNLHAHGIAPKRGGMKNLLNVMLEGFLSCAGVGPLSHGGWDNSAGPHGPIYIILDGGQVKKGAGDKQLKESKEVFQEQHFPEEKHLAYVVPGKRDAQLAKDTLAIACEEGFITSAECNKIFTKVLTYKELLDMQVRDSRDNIDHARFKAAMKKRVAQAKGQTFIFVSV